MSSQSTTKVTPSASDFDSTMEALKRLALLVNDPHPGLATWVENFLRVQRSLGFEPIRKK